MVMRGFYLCHQTVYNWVQKFGVELGIKRRSRRKGKCGKKWHVDATYVCIKAHWCYLYRAIDKEGNLVDKNARRGLEGKVENLLPAKVAE